MHQPVRYSIILAVTLTAAACSSSTSERIAAANMRSGTPQSAAGQAMPQSATPGEPRIVTPRQRLQCVPYARNESGIQIRGDAWTWWNSAAGKYQRSSSPAVGAVLVVKRTSRNRYGHLAVVTHIVNEREIIVRHANWLNKGRIHLDTPVRDVSSKNDWSSVKFWYTPGKVIGRSTYPSNGFIYPSSVQSAAR